MYQAAASSVKLQTTGKRLIEVHTSSNSKISKRNEDHNISNCSEKSKSIIEGLKRSVPLSAKSAKIAKYLRIKDQVAPEFGKQKSKDVPNQKQKEIGLLFYGNFYKYYFFSVNHLISSFQYP